MYIDCIITQNKQTNETHKNCKDKKLFVFASNMTKDID